MTKEKGFFDLGDIAWMVKLDLCSVEIVEAPAMDQCMFFDHNTTNGKMLRIFDINNDGTWKLLFDRLSLYSDKIRQPE
jgi:hypothetical protein